LTLGNPPSALFTLGNTPSTPLPLTLGNPPFNKGRSITAYILANPPFAGVCGALRTFTFGLKGGRVSKAESGYAEGKRVSKVECGYADGGGFDPEAPEGWEGIERCRECEGRGRVSADERLECFGLVDGAVDGFRGDGVGFGVFEGFFLEPEAG
jgi:hypothetical protein